MTSRKPPIDLPETDDPYALLDVRPGASADQIRRAYLRRVKIFKPDRFPAQFRRVREAYDRLREQEAWFDAWRQANEVVRQAQQQAQEREDGEAEAEVAPSAQTPPDGDPEPALADEDEVAAPGVSADPVAEAEDDDVDVSEPAEPSVVEMPDIEPSDEALHAEALQEAEDDDEPSLERIMAQLETELRQGDAPTGSATDARDTSPQLADLTMAVHEDLIAERYADAAERLLERDVLPLAPLPGFSHVLLEACCALVWAAPARFDDLVARYGDLITAKDTEFRQGALLHRRTLSDELAGWKEMVADWPQLHRFVLLGSSLRPPDEAELGLHLGRAAAEDPSGLLQVLGRAARRAPGIVALYIGMAERWARRYDRLPTPVPRTLPSVDDAADSLTQTARTHQWVRWEQTRPLLVTAVMGAILILSSSIVIELVMIGLLLVLWAWRAWAGDPSERIYLRVLQPAAASWLWTTRASPDELAVAFAARLPRPGTWAAVLHPGNLSSYPHLLGNDLALLAFGVTAPMIPQLGTADRDEPR